MLGILILPLKIDFRVALLSLLVLLAIACFIPLSKLTKEVIELDFGKHSMTWKLPVLSSEMNRCAPLKETAEL